MNKQEHEENISILKSIIPEYEMRNKTFGVNALRDAISALEKQIPKKIDHDYLSCNSCDGDLEVFARMDIVHCPWCGQRLDWSVEE